MRKPLPLPSTLNARDIVDRIRERHREDRALENFPDPEHLTGVIAYVLRHHRRLPQAAAQDDVLDAILLGRLAEEELLRHQLGALRAAKAARIKTPRLARATGIRTRQGTLDRIALLTRKVTANRLHVSTDALDETGPPDHGSPADADTVRNLASRLLDCWGQLTTDPGIDDWAEDIELTLKAADSPSTTKSLVAQLRIVVREIDELAERTTQPTAKSEHALALLDTARHL